MQLISPSMQFENSYMDYINELGSEERYPFTLDLEHKNFPALLKKLDDFKRGVNSPDNSVPNSTFWLVEKSELIGVTNIRHYLNEKIEFCGGHIGLGIRPSYRGKGLGRLLMALSINKLIEMGVNPVYIHCYKDNTASVRTIITNGGTLSSEIIHNGKIVQRFVVKNLIT